MPQKILAKQMLEANKAAFDNSFSAMVTLQEQAEKMTDAFLDQAAWLPDEGKTAFREWLKACKKGRDDYKKLVEEGYQRVSDFLESLGG